MTDGRGGRQTLAYPDTLVGTDSHTTMINGLGVVGWGVGGIEAEAAMLGQPISMLIPQVLGFRLTGAMLEGATATDLVLTITERLRKHGVVGKFVEFFGPGLEHLTIADRATLGNMCPGVRRDDRDLPDRRDDARLPAADRPRRVAGAARRGLCEGAGAVPQRRRPGSDLHARRSSSISATVEPSLAGPAAAAGSRVAEAGEERLPDGAADAAGRRPPKKGAAGRRVGRRVGADRRRCAVAEPPAVDRRSITARS